MEEFIQKIRRGFKKPPSIIFKRLQQEIFVNVDRFYAKHRLQRLTLVKLLKITQESSLKNLWDTLSRRAFCVQLEKSTPDILNKILPHEAEIIFEKARCASLHQVDLLGSGLIDLGCDINWHKDYKSGYDWPMHYMRDIDYNNPNRPSDVKFPWEVSRLQWLIPLAQAFLLTNNENYAKDVKAVILSWIDHNPYSYGINWACTMEVALRIVVFTYFFHVFYASSSWQDPVFQEKFLKTLYLHADFTMRHLEFSDVNGNHYTANATGLVFAGLFWGDCFIAKRWHDVGWDILCKELPKQVYNDGVDFEGSVPYHRLVLELFFFSALYRERCQLETPLSYKNRLLNMAFFVSAYSQPDGMAPFWGDADDARTLPLGSQLLNDHRYLIGLIGHVWNDLKLLRIADGSWSEFYWLFGLDALVQRQKHQEKKIQYSSCAFPEGGFYILRNSNDYVFIDCGPLGLAGRGGHGHNDCLSFEAVLNGVKLISDCGAYIYTGSYEERNLFRSTAYHNTPCIDGEEINRFIHPNYLWNLHNDADPKLIKWVKSDDFDLFLGMHSGYMRLPDPVLVKREIILFHKKHEIVITDIIESNSTHDVSIPFHFAEKLIISQGAVENSILIKKANQNFQLSWESFPSCKHEILSARVSPAYGKCLSTLKLILSLKFRGNIQIKCTIKPVSC